LDAREQGPQPNEKDKRYGRLRKPQRCINERNPVKVLGKKKQKNKLWKK
jgi:hypothetical protein